MVRVSRLRLLHFSSIHVRSLLKPLLFEFHTGNRFHLRVLYLDQNPYLPIPFFLFVLTHHTCVFLRIAIFSFLFSLSTPILPASLIPPQTCILHPVAQLHSLLSSSFHFSIPQALSRCIVSVIPVVPLPFGECACHAPFYDLRVCSVPEESWPARY
jgi:hypothetical protein